MNVLSLFDGISCGRVALERAGIKVDNYYASEIDKYAMSISDKNYPDIVQVGSVVNLDGLMFHGESYPRIDLLIGGSPCQDLSIAGRRKGLNGERSGLFYEFVRLIKEIKPKYFVLENVNSMPKETKAIITMELFNIPPIMINASLVSAQNRKRLFWVGKLVGDTYEQVRMELPEDKEIYLTDILQENVDEKYYLTESNIKTINRNFGSKGKTLNLDKDNSLIEKMTYPSRINQKSGKIKSPTLTAAMGTGGGNIPVIIRNGKIRKFTEIECERLQTLPDDYTKGVCSTQRYKAIGNGWTVDVIAHILSFIK